MSQLSVLKAMSDDSRLRILCLLTEGALCVCEMEAVLKLLQSNVSRHLNKLTTSGLLSYYKQNKYIYYELNQGWLNEHAPFVLIALDKEKAVNPQVIEDLKRLAAYKSGEDLDDEGLQKLCWMNEGGKCCSQ